MNPKVFAADIPLYTGLDAADATANPFFAGDSVVRSLNRARLVAAQGVPPEWYGRTAGELLSARALADLAREAAGALHLDPDAPDWPAPQGVRHFLHTRLAALSETAQQIVSAALAKAGV